MATLMITGGKVGSIIGRRRAFGIGLVIYGVVRSPRPSPRTWPVLLIGWSLLEGIGAALIMPAIVALVAGNFPAERRPAAYGMVAAAGAVAVAAGPLIGGARHHLRSWRYVFLGEVVIVLVILVGAREDRGRPGGGAAAPRPGRVGALCRSGWALLVFGVLRCERMGLDPAEAEGAPSWGPVADHLVASSPDCLVVYGSFTAGRSDGPLRETNELLVRPGMLQNRQLIGGPDDVLLAVHGPGRGSSSRCRCSSRSCLELTALQTGLRLLPLSIALLRRRARDSRALARAAPRRVVRCGLASMIVGHPGPRRRDGPRRRAAIVSVPMLLMGSGLGALASQLGAVTVSAVPDSQSAEVGGLQNTATNLGASLGTALAGSLMIATLTTSFVANIQESPAIPANVKSQAEVQLVGGVPFISDADLEAALEEAQVDPETTDTALAAYGDARLDGLRAALAILAVLALVALIFSQRIPSRQPGGGAEAAPAS